MEAGTDIRTLRTRLVHEIRVKEEELVNLQASLHSVDTVWEMLKDRGELPNTPTGNENHSGGLYSGMGVKAAVLRLLQDYPNKEWGVRDVRDTLITNGFKPTTKHIYSVLSATLDRLAKDGVVNLEKTDAGKRYQKITGSVIQTTLGT